MHNFIFISTFKLVFLNGILEKIKLAVAYERRYSVKCIKDNHTFKLRNNEGILLAKDKLLFQKNVNFFLIFFQNENYTYVVIVKNFNK